MIGASAGIHNYDHFDIEIFSNLSPRIKQIRFIIINFSILMLAFFLITDGLDFAKSGMQRISLAARIPMIWIYSSFFFLGVSAIIFQVEHILKYFEKQPNGIHNS